MLCVPRRCLYTKTESRQRELSVYLGASISAKQMVYPRLDPHTVTFFSKEGTWLGDKKSLERQIHETTGIPLRALQGAPLHEFSKDDRLSWSEARHTMRKEDKAYSLLGIFGISMLPNYGEGEENAFRRLHKEITESLGGKVLSLDNNQRRILLDSLRFDQIDARQMTIKNAHTKTCKWLLKKPEYIDWLDTTKLGKHHGFLCWRRSLHVGRQTGVCHPAVLDIGCYRSRRLHPNVMAGRGQRIWR